MSAIRCMVRPTLLCALAVAVTIAGFGALANLREERGEAPMLPLLAAVAMIALQVTLLALAWRLILATLRPPGPGSSVAVRSFALGWLSRYIPGPPTGLAGKFLVCRSAGYSNGAIAAALFYENVLLLAAGAALPALTLGFALGMRWVFIEPLLLLATIAGAAAVTRPTLMRGAARVLGRGRLPSLVQLQPVPRRALVGPAAMVFAAAACAGVSFHIVAVTLTDLPAGNLGLSLLIFSAASLTGFVTPFAPSGAGVRETVIVALLGPYVGGTDALSVAIVARGVAILLDVAIAGGLLGAYAVSGLRRALVASRPTIRSKYRA